MSIFTLKDIEAVTGDKCRIYQLVIDGISQLDEYESNIEAMQMPQFKTAVSYLSHLSEGVDIGPKFKKLVNNKKDKIPVYEIKVNKIRLYLLRLENGKIVVAAGLRRDQEEILEWVNKSKSIILNQLSDEKK